MKERILQLCKRLNKFSLDEIATISEIDSTELSPILKELMSENFLIKKQSTYYYQRKQKELTAKLPLIFQYHSNQTINYIIKGFCADTDVKTMINIFDIGRNVMDKFYSYFRNILYEKQKTELLKYFESEPKIGQERIYMTAKVYLYLYNNKLYVSDKLLKADNLKKHTNEERLEIKNIYLRSFRKVLSRSYTHKFHLHLTEELWKWGKTFQQRYSGLNNILFS